LRKCTTLSGGIRGKLDAPFLQMATEWYIGTEPLQACPRTDSLHRARCTTLGPRQLSRRVTRVRQVALRAHLSKLHWGWRAAGQLGLAYAAPMSLPMLPLRLCSRRAARVRQPCSRPCI